MQSNLDNQANSPQITQNPNQPLIDKQAGQPNIVQQNPASITAPPQPQLPIVFDVILLKKKLCIPILVLWIICILLLVDFFYILVIYDTISLILGLSCIAHFVVAHIISISSETCDAKQYKLALYIYLGFCIFAFIYHFLAIAILNKYKVDEYEKLHTGYKVELIVEPVILIGLYFLKKIKEFQAPPIPENQQIVQ